MTTHLPFFDEIKRCLRKVGPNLWELTEPHLLYLDDEQAVGYLKLMQDQSYSKSFHNETVQLIENHLNDLFPSGERSISLIDLGPGYPDKALPMAKFLRNKNTEIYYYPVDVSLKYLDLAKEEMAPFCKGVFPINALFESAYEQMPKDAYERPVFVMIGLTFMNFPGSSILQLLKQLARRQGGGWAIFATELITPQNQIDGILNAYRGETMGEFTFGPLRHLGFNYDRSTFEPIYENHRVEHRFTIEEEMPGVPILKGDMVVTAISYRYSLDEITNILHKNFTNGTIWCSPSNKTALLLGEV
ncbi:MAG: L-histidine N(alpha)-methyltransferase [Deltaproteobacteria bacterium]|nr:L-histidine N(alpha)-methyltransferase [Deltaproteobacteria bacterium]